MEGDYTRMKEQLLEYMSDHWQGENEEFLVRLSDATFQKHFKVYLESQGICSLTFLELEQKVRQMQEQRFQAFQRFRQLDYWLTCGDSAVTLQPRTYEVYMRLNRESK